MADILVHLNEQQRAAVQATNGPVLILAGAGSGKTRALTHRIAYLVEQRLAQPSEILAVTFTNKAAGAMKERVRKLLGNQQQVPSAISTFHSLGARLLREAASFTKRSASFSILDTNDTERLIRQGLREAGISAKVMAPRAVRQAISTAKSDLFSPETFAAGAQSKTDEIVALIWPRYEALLAAHDAYDFDDLLVETVRLLQHHPAVRSTWQHRWRYLSVDEYQDTNALQERLLQLLLGPEKNICVVGDDYQAIYSWRGAKVDHILAFEERYPGCQVIHLTQNYRSTPEILTVAGEVIAGNRAQKHKTLWTKNTTGQKPAIVALTSDREEASYIRQAIEAHVASGGTLADCVVLYRTNAQSRLFEEEFLTHQIPYAIVGGFRFYERREIKDALALLSWYINPNNRLALERIAAALLPRIGPKTIDRWYETAIAGNQTLRAQVGAQSMSRPALVRLTKAYETAPTGGTVATLLHHLLKQSEYLTALKELPDGEERLENINELLNVTSVYEDPVKFLEEVSLLTDLDTQSSGDKVTCMTLHAAKGLEFPLVFIVGCEEELVPHINSVSDPEKLEEERRLLYVGITRARKQLTLTHAQTRYRAGQLVPRLPSRFLDAIASASRDAQAEQVVDEELVYVSKGEWVTHPHFGRGVVIAVGKTTITCVFAGHGVKTIDAKYAEAAY